MNVRQNEQRAAAQAGKIRFVFDDSHAIQEGIESAHGPGHVTSLKKEIEEINGDPSCVTIEYDTRTKALTWVRSAASQQDTPE